MEQEHKERGPDRRTGEAVLARLGLSASRAVGPLRSLGVWVDDGPTQGCWPVVEAIAAAANADTALQALTRLAERRPHAWARLMKNYPLLRKAAIVAGVSEALGDLYSQDTEALAVLEGDLESQDATTVRHHGVEALSESPQESALVLAGVQRRGLLRIAARDLLGWIDTPAASRELSALADGVLAAALDHATHAARDAGQDARMAVIGMGKLGGSELNYVSDVDVLFVHDGKLEVATAAARRFLGLLGSPTPRGRVYEIDASLRPEGRDGPLSRTLDAYAAYYDRWAKTWEFQALLKARPVAGDPELGRAFIAMVAPHVWPDRLDVEAVAEIQRMKGVVESSAQVRRDGPRQLKLAPGGLRDIEFAVQLLQLVHGRHDHELRSPNTLEALDALARGGYVDDGDAALFSDTYQFLRTVEHRLQLRRLRRTHTIPRGDAERYRLARATGFRDISAASALVQFDRQYGRTQSAARRLHEKLFYRPLLSRFADLGSDQIALAGEPARERLAALGFSNAAGALAHIEALAGGVGRSAQLFGTLLPAILPVFAEQPDPDGGLASLRSLAERLGDSPFFLRTLRDNPPVGELLARVLGRSRLVGEWLERQPEVIGAMADLAGLQRTLEPEDYRRLAGGIVRRRSSPAGAADALRRLRRREMARTAVRDLGGQAGITDVMRELTGLAEACLEAGVALAPEQGVRLAIIGMGRLGSGELSYSSDLDVLMVFAPAEGRDEALLASERLLRLLSDVTPEGQAFRVDPNLRPEGRTGTLARTLDSYLSYYRRWGKDWELQALTQARPVAGDLELGSAFVEAVTSLVYPPSVPAERLQAVRMMKARVERERAGRDTERLGRQRLRSPRNESQRATGPARPPSARADLKLGPGGLSDVEWTVQLLQIAHGGEIEALRGPGTLAALDACEAAGLLTAADARWLRDGWLLLSRVRNALYLAGQRESDRLPGGREDREHLARLLDYPSVQAFAEDLDRAMRRIRKVHERAFYRQ
ncbi:MAG: bifunctional [glutamine synthetase] adenylyltransferase/[glutamine synthetase]-adenylyl-L-tyrosine phosphorylase [Egibacteraceae bacterium]